MERQTCAVGVFPKNGLMRVTAALMLLLMLAAVQTAHGAVIFINEIHYDNSGADANEGVEIAGEAGTRTDGWSLALYNGTATVRSVYSTVPLSGLIPDQQTGFGTLFFPIPGIQNGSPDGLALVDPADNPVQFLSYEGSFTAADGPAAGLSSVDLGVRETSDTPIGMSLQLAGVGGAYEAFTWSGPTASTFGAINSGQNFIPNGQPFNATTAPEPGTVFLFGSGVAGLLGLTRKRKKGATLR